MGNKQTREINRILRSQNNNDNQRSAILRSEV